MELVVIPWKDLEAATIQAVIESFVLREGTNYGMEEALFETKVAQVRRQLEEGSIFLVYDPVEDSCTLLTGPELKRLQKTPPAPPSTIDREPPPVS